MPKRGLSRNLSLRFTLNARKISTQVDKFFLTLWRVKILKDGRILSWSWDNTLRLWSSEGKYLAIMNGHSNEIIDVQILSDGVIMSYSEDGIFCFWTDEGKLKTKINLAVEKVKFIQLQPCLITETKTESVAVCKFQNAHDAINIFDCNLR